jgi:hypothetical protein
VLSFTGRMTQELLNNGARRSGAQASFASIGADATTVRGSGLQMPECRRRILRQHVLRKSFRGVDAGMQSNLRSADR